MTNVGLQPGHFDASKMEAIELPFTQEEYCDRLQRLLGMAREKGLDLLWITSPEGVAWTHGFFASWYKGQGPMRYPQCYGTAVHVESGRYIHFDNPTEEPVMARTSVSKDNRYTPDREAEPNIRFIMDELKAEGWLGGTVGMEFWSYVPNRAVSTMFEGAFLMHGCRPVDMSEMVRSARRQKSPQEIAYTEQAMACCDIGHKAIMEHLRPGITELDLFGKVMGAMMEAGGEFSALIPIFNASPMDGEIPMSNGHTMASRKVIQAGEMLCADLCGVYNRYHANALRGYFVGDNPPQSLVEQYKKSAGSFEVITSEVKAGMTVAEVIRLLRAYYEEVGIWTETAGWGVGYELGWSLPPDWVGDFYFHLGDDKYLDRVFEENMVTNFESLFNTHLIDTLVYEKDQTRILSKTPLELIAVG
ncbi:MAG: M24 family metallopeptidase [Alphaproteobacteria bacterium]|jgi:Xaa-Pro aminopeptidase|nr:aminopeptidase P family protein [Rhodospirillaceae bacterium]MBT7645760.1 aminopeptidase P family protein [Rhodospirillaceae bacterium]MDG2479614.1 M24 family metallopeptidase [Alphaproteobacteria bacterium]